MQDSMQARQHSADKHGDIGNSSTKFDQRNTQFHFLRRQACQSSRQRCDHHALDLKMRCPRSHVDVANRRRVGKHDMDVDAQPIRMQPKRIFNTARAIELHMQLLPLHKHLFVEPNPIPVKWALAKMGKCGGTLRLPLTPLSDGAQSTVEAALREAGVL